MLSAPLILVFLYPDPHCPTAALAFADGVALHMAQGALAMKRGLLYCRPFPTLRWLNLLEKGRSFRLLWWNFEADDDHVMELIINDWR